MTVLRRNSRRAFAVTNQRLKPASSNARGTSDYEWWFEWEQDKDPLTFWDRRRKKRKDSRNPGNTEE